MRNRRILLAVILSVSVSFINEMAEPVVAQGGPLDPGRMRGFLPFYFNPTSPYFMPYAFSANRMSLPDSRPVDGTTPSIGPRPNVRPRLDVSDPSAMKSISVLRKIREEIAARIAGIPERPFTSPWYVSRANLSPLAIGTKGAWARQDWDELKQWVGVSTEPVRYDYRSDRSGLVFVYCDEEQQGRAVDARGPATQLADAIRPADHASSSVSLGVFAAVSPDMKPVDLLVHLAIDRAGFVSGYHFDMASNVVEPVRGALDSSSQCVAWRVGDTVAEAGFKNLTEDVGRAIVFLEDGWTQPWILIQIATADNP